MNEERRKILKMVEEGIISSEEAEELFDQLDKKAHRHDQDNSITEQVDWEKSESYRSKQTHQSKSKRAKVLSFMEEAFTKIKNVDLDFNFGPFFSVSHVFQNNQADFSDVEIDLSNGSLVLVPWDEGDVRVECEAKVYQVENQDEARHKFLSSADFSLEDGRMQFFLSDKQIKVKVIAKIPNRLYDKVSAHLFNGPITAEHIEVRQFSAKTTNGSIALENVNGEKISLETANGKIEAEKGVAEEIEAETISGTVRLDGKYNKVDAQVVNGSIHCTWEEVQPHTAFLKTTTGNIRLHVPNDVKVDGKLITNIGNIHCHLMDYKIVEQKKDMVQRSLLFEANQNSEALLHLEAETKTGSIWVFPNQ
ncbi:DUF4097 family beta strand repeat-containing protein [Aquibacillus albus]|uniref:DUF4097 and DUF4098 domain-containing protein YvlB n=1 Tax=Aquibacillus albus TaxID=1168171 RepID=A0ABS2N5X4_9BACI|nr:DUF4097 domain-containing protein [Aquibacillus albus]MBM7573535.1 DUF4097 and DUF4098 domain-containing protein YvlB [Aquibacillus albus]